MNTSATTFRPNNLESIGRNLSLAAISSKQTADLEEDVLRFSTTDGSMMTYHAGTNAVRNGAGIFIGGYFVGVAEESMFAGNMPFIHY